MENLAELQREGGFPLNSYRFDLLLSPRGQCVKRAGVNCQITV